MADIVVPIAYGIKGGQHYHNLIAYKGVPPARGAFVRLQDLLMLFLHEHGPCLERAANGSLTHLAIVPSTRGRTEVHPLRQLVAPIGLPMVGVTANAAYPPTERGFHADRFQVSLSPASDGADARVLALDDTWTTGSRVQSLAHGLKLVGARAVVAVILGRHVNPDYRPTLELLDRIRHIPFDISRCSVPGCEDRA